LYLYAAIIVFNLTYKLVKIKKFEKKGLRIHLTLRLYIYIYKSVRLFIFMLYALYE